MGEKRRGEKKSGLLVYSWLSADYNIDFNKIVRE
jgi:hypothetical protein